MIRTFAFLLSCLLFLRISAQPGFPVNGVQNPINTVYAFTHATLYTAYDTKLEDATLIVKGGTILQVGTQVSIPAGAVITDLTGKTIYPAFIDAFTNYGMPDTRSNGNNGSPQFVSNKKGAFGWNEAIRAEFSAALGFAKNESAAAGYRSAGFGSVYTFKNDGIVRGSGCVVSLGDVRENELMLKQQAGANYSFDKGSSPQDYPSSLMGSIALLRQTYYDAKWYAQQNTVTDLTLQAFNALQKMPQIFDAGEKWNVLRADKVGDEFGVQYAIKTNGSEYQRIQEIKNTRATLIVPVCFPAPYNTTDVYDAQRISTTDMLHWYFAPSNLALLEQNSIDFCITAYGCDAGTFLKNLRTAVQRGLSEKAALKALLYQPARLFDIENLAGSLKPGMPANFIISSGNIFIPSTVLYENWIQGKKFVLQDMNIPDVRGTYDLYFSHKMLLGTMLISGDRAHPQAKVITTDTLQATLTTQNDFYSLAFDAGKLKYTLTGTYSSSEKKFTGNFTNSLGETANWEAVLTRAPDPKNNASDNTVKVVKPELPMRYPFTDFGWTEAPKQETILFKNATVYTCENEGILKQTDVLVSNGKIQQIGKNLQAANARVIDAEGKYITPGIIDEHSHIAIWYGVNEGTQSVTSEVRIGDVLWPEDINIYRQLAGGVTSSHLLHGSANTIGGQTQLIKLRWGKSAEEMKFEGADGFIKFALGENVKQSNWGDRQTVRFPQTRMGVEQVLLDAFTRAKEYQKAQAAFIARSNDKKNKEALVPVRRDLELDALSEILNKKRFITCHSYVQSEINMLMHVGDSMGFTVNTFTHILEGYKVADKMKAHGANASNFADWWAYKFEVYDAIPYNSAIMTRVGLNVAVNSDDAEMARRLNQEAAKSMKYGNLTAEEAIRLCTINPAKMLHIDQRTGSIKTGKDADLVIWNADPLSIYAKPLFTLVDGTIYFDAAEQKKRDEQNAADRAFLMRKMTEMVKAGEKANSAVSEEYQLYDCESLEGVH